MSESLISVLFMLPLILLVVWTMFLSPDARKLRRMRAHTRRLEEALVEGRLEDCVKIMEERPE